MNNLTIELQKEILKVSFKLQTYPEGAEWLIHKKNNILKTKNYRLVFFIILVEYSHLPNSGGGDFYYDIFDTLYE